MISRAWRRVMSGEMVTGSTIIPLSERLTRSTSSPWRSMGIFLCTMPMPPWRAMAMDRRDSVKLGGSVLSSVEELDQRFPRESRLSEQRDESAFRDVAVMLGNDRSAFRGGMVIDKVAARDVVEDKTVALQES